MTIGHLFSCSLTDKKTAETSLAHFKTKDTIISFTGYWLCKEYSESIHDFKSPKKAQDNSMFIFIPDRTLKQTMMITNFHEGGPVLTVLKNRDHYELWETQEDSLTQQIDKIELIDPMNLKIGNRFYVKINPIQNDNNAKILEEILFKGTYSNATGTTIEFKNTGQVIGLDNFTLYEPVIDYIDAGMQVDQIGLGNDKTEIEYYGFKFHKDTLKLYKLNCLTYDSTENRCVDVAFGLQTHQLWKKK